MVIAIYKVFKNSVYNLWGFVEEIKRNPFVMWEICQVLRFPARGPWRVGRLTSLRSPFTVVIASYASRWYFSVAVSASYITSWKDKLSLLPVVSTSLDKQLHYYCLCYVVFTWKFLLIVQFLDGRLHTKRVMENHEATVEKQGACMQNVSLGGGYQIMSHFKDLMPVFAKQEFLEQPEQTPVDLAECEQFSLRTLCWSEVRTTPAPSHEP